MVAASSDIADASLSLTDEQWERLASKRIFFGHQSVGENIISGIRILEEDASGPRLRILSADTPEAATGPGLIEAFIGQNGSPASKADDFRAALDAGIAGAGDIVLYKHCYLDVTPTTDPEVLFAEYQQSIEAAKAAHPELVFAHVTLPLTTDDGPVKGFVKRLLGRTTARELNAKRGRFNDLLLETYAGSDPVFDLAEIQSTGIDGSRNFVRTGSGPIYTLAEGFTDDGGHLNRTGQVRVASFFLRFLGEL